VEEARGQVNPEEGAAEKPAIEPFSDPKGIAKHGSLQRKSLYE
jgi:hypothetical protein